MSNLKVHSLGEVNYLKSLKEQYKLLVQKIKLNSKLTHQEKEQKLKEASQLFNKKKKNTKSNLY